jgi:hypothetical protein
MELVEIHMVRPERPKGVLQLLPDVLRTEQAVPFEKPSELVTELRCNDPVVPFAVDSFAHQDFRQVIAVAFGRVYEVDAAVLGCAEYSVYFAVAVLSAPFPAELPRANPNYADVQVRLS